MVSWSIVVSFSRNVDFFVFVEMKTLEFGKRLSSYSTNMNSDAKEHSIYTIIAFRIRFNSATNCWSFAIVAFSSVHDFLGLFQPKISVLQMK